MDIENSTVIYKNWRYRLLKSNKRKNTYLIKSDEQGKEGRCGEFELV